LLQSKPLKIKRKEFKKEENGFKDAWYATKDGSYYFRLGSATYSEPKKIILKLIIIIQRMPNLIT